MISAFALLALSTVSTGGAPASAAGPFSIAVVEDFGDTGAHSSLALNAEGFPVIAYVSYTGVALMLAACSDRACADPPTVNVVDADGPVGAYASLELDGSGFPVIAYYDPLNGDLKLARCSDTTCTAAPTIVALDAGDTRVGAYASLELNSADVPVISYYDEDEDDLKLMKCSDLVCSAPAITSLDTNGDVGTFTSLALNSDDFPVISYAAFDPSPAQVKVAICMDTACVDSTDTGIASPANPVTSTSLVLRNGSPVVSYSTSDGVRVVSCADAMCNSEIVDTVIETGDGGYTSLALGPSGFPAVSYGSNQTLRIAVCNDATCGTTTQPNRTLTTVDSGPADRWSSLAFDDAGNPFISYYAETEGNLQLAYLRETTSTIWEYAGAPATQAPQPDEPDPAGESPTAAAAKLGWPTNLALDVSGNLYFTDRYNHTVRMVSADGETVTTVAGQPGLPCPVATDACGDGEAATSAFLRSPWGIAVDGGTPANVYVSDYGDHRIRMIDAGSGIITTIAGTGDAGYNGDDIPATEAELHHPSGLAVDVDGSILVADRGNHRVRRISTGINLADVGVASPPVAFITTFLGTGTAGEAVPSCSTLGATECTLNQPTDIEVRRGTSDFRTQPPGTDFFIADRANDAVLVTRDGGADGIIADTIEDRGIGVRGPSSPFDQPVSLAYDAVHQELFIADSNHLVVRRYSLVTFDLTVLAGNGEGKLGTSPYVTPGAGPTSPLATALNFPIGVAFRPTGGQARGSLFVTSVYENQIRRIALAPPPPPPPPP